MNALYYILTYFNKKINRFFKKIINMPQLLWQTKNRSRLGIGLCYVRLLSIISAILYSGACTSTAPILYASIGIPYTTQVSLS